MTDPKRRFSYADYEKTLREPQYEAVRAAARQTAAKFQGCRRVLDVASGQGFLLEALQQLGIQAVGVDNETHLVTSCQQKGFSVFYADALQFLSETEERFDGVNCSHFIEHLPFEGVLDLVEGMQRVLLPGGRLVLRWPNPRSLEMQHISFWKDPTHVRFYDGQLVEAVLSFYGFEVTLAHYAEAFPRITPGATDDATALPEPVHPTHTLRQKAGQSLRRLINGSLRNTGWHRLLAARDNKIRPQSVLRHLVDVPLEAEIIALQGSDAEFVPNHENRH